MLFSTPIVTNICTTDVGRSKAFYTGILGLPLKREMGDAAFLLDAGGQDVFVYGRDAPPQADHTVASWAVEDIRTIVSQLTAKGIQFERYEGFDQDDLGIGSRGPDGPHAAWFKDPDGNILALTQCPAS